VRASLLWWKWRLFLVNLIAFSLSPLQGWEGESEGPLEEKRVEERMEGGKEDRGERMRYRINMPAFCLSLLQRCEEVRRCEGRTGLRVEEGRGERAEEKAAKKRGKEQERTREEIRREQS
jgi:hypothetical protein